MWLSGLNACLQTWTSNPSQDTCLGCRPGSNPSQDTCLGCRPGPQLGACKRQLIDVVFTHQCFSPSFPLSLKINKIFFFKKEAQQYYMILRVREPFTHTHSLSYRNENKWAAAAAPNSMDESCAGVKWNRKVHSVWLYWQKGQKPDLNHDDKSQNRGDLGRAADWEEEEEYWLVLFLDLGGSFKMCSIVKVHRIVTLWHTYSSV